MKTKYILSILFIFALLIIGCVPPEDVEPVETIDPEQKQKDCDRYVSFAYTNYQNGDWESVIRNYRQALDTRCEDTHAEDIFPWMGAAYIKLYDESRNAAYLDSAATVYNKGIQFISDNTSMLISFAWVEGLRGNIEDQVYILEKILVYDETNVDVMESLAGAYDDQDRCDDLIYILEKWQKIEPNSSKVLGELTAAYIKCGMDELELIRKRCEQNPDNVQFCLEYAEGLINADRYEEAVAVLKEVKFLEPDNERVLKYLAESYLEQGRQEDARITYEDLYRVNRTDYQVPIALTEIYIDRGEYETAHTWAERAVTNSGGKGEAYNIRAEVYFNTANACQTEELKFMDKVVYELAYEDYKEAVNRNYPSAKVRRDFLKENFITTKSDWFMRPADEYEVKPAGSCYSWITRTVKRK